MGGADCDLPSSWRPLQNFETPWKTASQAHLAGLENDERVEALAWYCQGLGFEVEAKTALWS